MEGPCPAVVPELPARKTTPHCPGSGVMRCSGLPPSSARVRWAAGDLPSVAPAPAHLSHPARWQPGPGPCGFLSLAYLCPAPVLGEPWVCGAPPSLHRGGGGSAPVTLTPTLAPCTVLPRSSPGSCFQKVLSLSHMASGDAAGSG